MGYMGYRASRYVEAGKWDEHSYNLFNLFFDCAWKLKIVPSYNTWLHYVNLSTANQRKNYVYFKG